MKSCPTCNRTYPGDEFVFCLEDGALLSAPHQTATAQRDPGGPIGKAPPTEVLSAPTMPASQRPPLQSTIVAPGPQFSSSNQEPRATSAVPKAGPGYWLLRLALVLRGVATIIGGIAFYTLVASYNGFFGVLGVHLITGGALATVASIGSYMEYKRGGRLLVDAIVSLFSGFLIIVLAVAVNHAAGFNAVLVVVAIWAIIIGVAEIGAAIHLRTYITGNKLLAATGVASVIFGIAVFVRVLHFGLLFSIYGLTFGVLLVVLGVKMRSKTREH